MSPNGEFILVHREPPPTETSEGVLIPTQSRIVKNEGTVVECGAGVKPSLFHEPGTTVVWASSGRIYHIDEEYLVIHQEAIYLSWK